VLHVYTSTGSALNDLHPLVLPDLSGYVCSDQHQLSDQSLLAFDATAGTTYLFQVGGYYGARGNLAFHLAPEVARS